MGYLHINNLYKEQLILMFKRCYALEKIHGTSAHIAFKANPSNTAQRQLVFFSGGESYANFVALFDKDALLAAFKDFGIEPEKDVIVYGEAYGGKQQKMSATYGPKLKFVAFDVCIDGKWLEVPKAESFVKKLGLEFVHYVEVSTDMADLDAQRDADSEQAIRNGVGAGKIREGVVLRPPIEVILNNGSRIIAKHKRDEFRETASPRVVDDPDKLKVLADAEAVANEWVVMHRLKHVLDKLPDANGMEKVRDVIIAMTDDVLREGAGEIVDSKEVRKAISARTVSLFKTHLENKLKTT